VTPAPSNVHATALLVGGKGVIIFGGSGAGKTSLALELIREALRDDIEAKLVSDDRVELTFRNGELVASPPARLAGLVEVRGSGIHEISNAASAKLHLAVELVNPQEAERISPAGPQLVAHGVKLPALKLPIGETGPQVRAVLAYLGLYGPLQH
jgi:serine kinase of HPr protein (carbohydrate metabolism regulator)